MICVPLRRAMKLGAARRGMSWCHPGSGSQFDMPQAYKTHRIHGATYGSMDPINIPLYVSIYTSTMDPI